MVNLNEKDENKIIESAATNDEPQQEAAKTTTKLTSTVAILESRDSRHNKVIVIYKLKQIIHNVPTGS